MQISSHNPLLVEWEVTFELPDEDALSIRELSTWMMLFNGGVQWDGAGAGVVLMSPERLVLTFSFILGKTFSNNIVEYQALIIILENRIRYKDSIVEHLQRL